MNTASQEDEDALRVNEALESIQNGLLDNALLILTDVVKNTPQNYVYSFKNNGILTLKFWDKIEFLHYVEWVKEHGGADGVEKILWVLSAYPRAFYYLSFISIEEKEFKRAFEYLNFGEALEPTNPRFAIEKGTIALKLKDYEPAIKLFEQVPNIGPHVTGKAKALALRGIGMALIELQKLEAAEKLFWESLRYDPESSIAQNEIKYIRHLRSGKLQSPLETFSSKAPKPTQCMRCGKTFQNGKVFNKGGALVFICESCLKDMPAKKWWEIWK